MSRLVVAVDVPDAQTAERIVDDLYSLDVIFKFGLESLFGYAERIFTYCEARDVRCVIDAKLHDIPRTVVAAVRQLVRPFVRAITIHASGGEEMVRSAVEAAATRAGELGIRAPDLFAVTVLTSLDDTRTVPQLAKLAAAARCAGVVCGVREVRQVHETCGEGFLTMTPGIRPSGIARNDQRRSATPAEALAAGADYLVVGRPIVDAPDRRRAASEILDEIAVRTVT